MQPHDWAVILIRLLFSFAAGTAGLLLWGKTREKAWTAVILAALLHYLDILLAFLDALGVADLSTFSIFGFPVLGWVLGTLSSLSLLAAFVLALRRIRRDTV